MCFLAVKIREHRLKIYIKNGDLPSGGDEVEDPVCPVEDLEENGNL